MQASLLFGIKLMEALVRIQEQDAAVRKARYHWLFPESKSWANKLLSLMEIWNGTSDLSLPFARKPNASRSAESSSHRHRFFWVVSPLGLAVPLTCLVCSPLPTDRRQTAPGGTGLVPQQSVSVYNSIMAGLRRSGENAALILHEGEKLLKESVLSGVITPRTIGSDIAIAE